MRNFLTTSAAIEKTIAAIYRRFVETIPCDGELKAIWMRMAKDEDQHAMEINFAARLPHEGISKVKEMPQARLEQLFDFTKRILDQARTSTIPVKTAVDLTLKLEEEFLAVHIASSVAFETETMRKMFQSIGQSEEEHCRAIREYSHGLSQNAL
ncbi:MAG: hypothetical protein OQK97_12105 [Deltaproteobacteria bacterium]|nr:hypothetical protein [Deltaproteobacteria bacterium]